MGSIRREFGRPPAARDAGTRAPGNIGFHIGDVAALPQANGVGLGDRAVRVLRAVPDAAAVLGEARRVLVPRGRAVLVGQDS